MSGEELPEGWAEVRVADVCAVNPRDGHLDDEVEVTFVPMAAVSEVTGTIERPEVRKTQDVRKGFTSFVDEDVIFAKITPCMENGKSAVATGLLNGRGYGSTEFVVLRSKGGINPSFLHRFVRQDAYRREARGTMQSGVGQARVPKEFIENTTLMLPPLPEQKRIVARLDALQARSRAAREALAEVPALLDTFRQSMLAAAFRGDLTAEWRAKNPDVEPASKLLERIRAERKTRWEKANPKKKYVEPEPVDDSELPELPEGWAWASGEVVTTMITDGTHQPPPRTDAGVPFIGITDVVGGHVDWRSVSKWVSDETHRLLTANGRLPVPGDVLYTTVGATYGTAFPVPDARKFVFQRHIAHLRPIGAVLSNFLLHQMNGPQCFDQAKRGARGGAQPTVNLGVLREMRLAVCGRAEQQEIVRLVDHALANLASWADVSREAGKALDTLDQSILARAFRGELVDQDPNDEPAEVLLARIRHGGDAAPARGRARRTG